MTYTGVISWTFTLFKSISRTLPRTHDLLQLFSPNVMFVFCSIIYRQLANFAAFVVQLLSDRCIWPMRFPKRIQCNHLSYDNSISPAARRHRAARPTDNLSSNEEDCWMGNFWGRGYFDDRWCSAQVKRSPHRLLVEKCPGFFTRFEPHTGLRIAIENGRVKCLYCLAIANSASDSDSKLWFVEDLLNTK